jgi:hypothetical protein
MYNVIMVLIITDWTLVEQINVEAPNC